MLKLLHEVGRSVAVLHENALLFVYRYGAGWPKPHFHPIYAPHSSRIMTLHAPHDWVHHRGLMWSLGRVARLDAPDDWIDFWQEREVEHDEDGRKVWPRPLPDHQRGVIRHVNFRTLVPGRAQAIICAEQEWWRADELAAHSGGAVNASDVASSTGAARPLISAVQTVTVYPSHEKSWHFDLEWQLSAPNGPLVLAPAPSDSEYGGTPYGLGCQFSREMAGGVLLNSHGCRNESCIQQEASWTDYSSPVDDDESGEFHWIGLTVMDHPSNPHHPSPFFAFREPIAFLASSPVALGPLTLGEAPIHFRYRIWVHEGRGTHAEIDGLYKDFAASRE